VTCALAAQEGTLIDLRNYLQINRLPHLLCNLRLRHDCLIKRQNTARLPLSIRNSRPMRLVSEWDFVN
jgi:hypothetical protein